MLLQESWPETMGTFTKEYLLAQDMRSYRKRKIYWALEYTARQSGVEGHSKHTVNELFRSDGPQSNKNAEKGFFTLCRETQRAVIVQSVLSNINFCDSTNFHINSIPEK